MKRDLAAAYRASMEADVRLPSGAEMRMRRKSSLMDFLYTGTMPAPLLNFVKDLISGNVSEVKGDDRLKMLETIDVIVCRVVIEPSVVPLNPDGSKPTLKDGELGVWEISDTDKAAIYNTVMDETYGAMDLEKFRAVPVEQAGSGSPTPVIEDIRPASESDSGPGQGDVKQ